MKAKKWPKLVWVGLDDFETPALAYERKPPTKLDSTKRYHLSPGNEVKLKRENAMMRKYIRDNHSDLCVCINCWKIHAKMPDLFRDGKRDK